MKKIILFIIIIAASLVTIYSLNKKEAVAPVVISPVTKDTPFGGVLGAKMGEFCFAKFLPPNQNGMSDKYTLRLILNGDKATGELNFLPTEKDNKTGEIGGTISTADSNMRTRMADLWWFASVEGMMQKEELKIILGEKTAKVGAGEMVNRGGGVYFYKDPKNISYGLELNSLPCGDFIKRVNIESYLRENISELSPVKPVLGGTWYVISDTIDLAKNSGTVTYEDGHIQEKKNFSFILNQKNEVTSLTIK